MSAPEGTTAEAAAAMENVRAHAGEWAALPLTDKHELLLRLHERVGRVAQEWVRSSCEGKGIPLGSSLESEEWLAGPYSVLLYTRALAGTVRTLAEDGSPLDGVRVTRRPDGRLALRVLPYDMTDRLTLNGFGAEMWTAPGVTEADLRAGSARRLRDKDVTEGVALVLGAGNVSPTAPLDVLYKLYHDNAVVVCKVSPVNGYLRPVLEEAFAPFVERGFVAFVSGGADVGAQAVADERAATIHITGSLATHDRIVFGGGSEGERRKADRAPVLRKTITSELGGVGATVILPGPWSAADLRFQAWHVATQKLNNSGFNCTASQVVVVPEGWELADAFIAELRAALKAAPQRPGYYPGADGRLDAALAAHPEAEDLGAGSNRRLFVSRLDPRDTAEPLFNTEFFAPVQGVVRLPGTPPEYLRAAVEFCNKTLAGTLGVNLIAHPRTLAALGGTLDDTLVALRFGSIAINTWTSLGYITPRVGWGAFPGNDTSDAGSGVGLTHNALLVDHVERTILTGPFRPAPRSLLHGEAAFMPLPPWFLNSRTGHRTARLLTEFAADPSPLRLAGVALSAVRN
ncbi:aldehyde dehydrogenase family protein [Streptomyces corynorhini]|uniref:Aldehyde dehydrogenase family protein n=1 Tax=Streptomyces corynorhini TaxID=2282652 RepID=A0A370BE48_9ACTN|nr:aldehyde dehydrogenase family protein [Streptomyces corynorhini]RDG38093.1 aldehyde dehydrogenase family protein [Streptomyces corynorhini]